MRCKTRHTIYVKLSTLVWVTCFIGIHAFAQKAIPSDAIIPTKKLGKYLKAEVEKSLNGKGQEALAEYFRQQFSTRYFYDWKGNNQRYQSYKNLYSKSTTHRNRAQEHMAVFRPNTTWVLPMTDKKGNPVSSYAFRHLARQHKMVDIALEYYESRKDDTYLRYFVQQVASLNQAVRAGNFERIKGGNGVFESFRSGYRILNWLEIHSLFLGEDQYSDEDQLNTIAALLQHGQHLYENNAHFHPGNHQTKGMSSLALLGILLQDFVGTDLWYKRAMERLLEHLDNEINDDGFQFERTIHYHKSDIANYYYVYQLAKKNKISIDPVWENKLNALFLTLVKIAYPDGTAPVLSDDTDNPWAEKNDIDGALTIGYLLFENPEYGYFAKNKVEAKMYWFMDQKQMEMLKDIKVKRPQYSSLCFPNTQYYIMRQGYTKGDRMMVISAGKDSIKPDHQHGDMLGIQASAYGEVVLPNYQVRYSLPDYAFFKNSMVKNVALVDEELLGKQYRSNKGKSGFGKFKDLPETQVIAWHTSDEFDFFAGSHDGFSNVGVSYSRQIIYVSDQFWIVKDNFSSDTTHRYHQVWQGHYTPDEGPQLLRSSFDNAVGCDIVQLHDIDSISSMGLRGKHITKLTTTPKKSFSFITIIYPYKGFDKGVEIQENVVSVSGFSNSGSSLTMVGNDVKTLTKGDISIAFDVTRITKGAGGIAFSAPSDVHVTFDKDMDTLVIVSLGTVDVTCEVVESSKFLKEKEKNKRVLKPGDKVTINLGNK